MPSQTEMILRLLLAAFLGSVIGFERERLSWAAGLRTHMLVCVGSALIMVISAFGFTDALSQPHVDLDPSRMAAQVVSGIGFLGAGSILLRGEVVRGLTTAASLWSVAAIGLAVGGGLYLPGMAATIIILLILAGLKPIERWYFQSRQFRQLQMTAERGRMSMPVLQASLGTNTYRVSTFIMQQNADNPAIDDITIAFERVSGREFDDIKQKLGSITGVLSVKDSRHEV